MTEVVAEDEVRVEVDGKVAILTIDRPKARNAIGLTTMPRLKTAIEAVGRSDATVLAIRGGGDRVFVSGGDLKELGTLRTIGAARDMAMSMRGVLDVLAALAIPVVGLLNGDAYGGGCEVAMACDFRIARADVSLAFNQIALGIMPAWGGIERLTSIVGRARAMYLLSTGRAFTASEAYGFGLVEEVVPPADFEKSWRLLLQDLADSSSVALRSIKAAVGTVAPPTWPDLAESSSAAFAGTWVSEAHWDAVERLTERRRLARGE
jgi:enoyl-CoA hydratase/carnithine racemase